jgi:hypothetical protein
LSRSMTSSLAVLANWLRSVSFAGMTRSTSPLPTESAIRTSSWSLVTEHCSPQPPPKDSPSLSFGDTLSVLRLNLTTHHARVRKNLSLIRPDNFGFTVASDQRLRRRAQRPGWDIS